MFAEPGRIEVGKYTTNFNLQKNFINATSARFYISVNIFLFFRYVLYYLFDINWYYFKVFNESFIVR